VYFVNTTISGNYATSTGGGLYNADGNPLLRNTIIWGNRTGKNDRLTADVHNAGGSPHYRKSDIGGSSIEGSWNSALGIDDGQNIDASPMFVKTGFTESGMMREGDYRLNGIYRMVVDGGQNTFIYFGYPGSVVLNRPSPANTSYGDHLLIDLANQGRVYNDVVDMGAYEFYGEAIIPDVIYEVTVPDLEGVKLEPPTGVYRVIAYDDFTLTLIPQGRKDLSFLTVKTGSVWMDERNGTEIVREAGGVVTIIFHEIVDPLHIQFSEGATGTEAIDAVMVWSAGGNLYVKTPTAGELNVYAATGSLFTKRTVGTGTTAIALPAGVYFVSFGDGVRTKVVVN